MQPVLTSEAAKFLEVAESLPIEMRIAVVDRLLESIQPVDSNIDNLWMTEIDRRVEEVESGEVQMIPGNEVMRKVREKFES
ncbi:MAG TPA: addiction module protein [Pyrinomonadaceae bacterium]|nr:addiction module protein [Pyrinomonadaceae bacterium]